MAGNKSSNSSTANQVDMVSALLTQSDNSQAGTVTLISAGIQLLLIKANEPHGEFARRISKLGIPLSLAGKAMRIALTFGGDVPRAAIARTGIGKTKLALLTRLDTESLDALASGGLYNGYTLDDILNMGVRKLQQIIQSGEPITIDKRQEDKSDNCTLSIEEKSSQREDEGTSSDHIPSVGSCYIEIDSNMTATVKECGSNIVVFSYKQYPQASHSLPLERFINNFKFISTPLLNLSKDDHKKTYCRELFRVALRYSGITELDILTKSVEALIARSLADEYNPGLNAASYEVYNKFVINRRTGK
ncbi:hypothetical protein [Pectobacterium colocasium]|uniref:hypothetical protein n=1 Tax=Pectobacterium colocasium TaxID=2878098 RepID=UPI003B2850FD